MADYTKADVARRQLGTAMSLFIRDLDPVSVHCLACGGGEIAESMAAGAEQKPFSQSALAAFPMLTAAEIKGIRNKFWNAFKHSSNRQGRPRQDDTLLSEFSDLANDHALFIGWFDWASAAGPLPIEVQTFQIWYLALYPGIVPFEGDSAAKRLFPKLAHLTRKRRKEVLRNEITKARRHKEVMSSPQTDRRPLIL